MKRIKVAHFGLAHDHSTVTLECARKYPDVFEVVGVCEPDEETKVRYGGAPAYNGVPWISEDELLERDDIDAVFCEGHELRSVSDAQKCINRGMHVHLDKPGGTDLAAFERLLRDADAKGLTVQMGYMYRYNPALRHVLARVQAGEMGEITGIDGSFSILHNDERRKWLGQFPGGIMFWLGCHIIDMIMLINGAPQGVVAFNRSSGWENDGSMDTCFAVLDYPHGTCSVRVNATEANGFARRRLHVVGTKRTIEIQPLECPTLVKETTFGDAIRDKCDDVSHLVFPGYLPGRYDDMLLEFASCVRGEMRNPYSSSYEISLQNVLLHACQQDEGREAQYRR